MNLIQSIEQQQIEGKSVPEFRVGDTVEVMVKVTEGNRQRLQAFKGVVIIRKNAGLNSSFTVRKPGVERVFPLYSGLIDRITVMRRGDVNQARLQYLRQLSGKAARIREKTIRKNKPNAAADKN